MDLDNVAAELRARDGGEAIDLGMAVGRRFWTAIIMPWLIVVGGVFAIGGLAAWAHGTVAMAAMVVTILWMLKPAYDRVPLFVVSRALFGDVPSTGRTLRHTLSRWLSIEMLFDCTVRRLTPYRSFTMPIRDLEAHSDRQYADRKSALLRRGSRRSVIGLIAVALVAEQLVLVGLVGFIQMVLPTEFQTGMLVNFSGVTEASGFPTWLLVGGLATYFLAMTAVEIFYIASGFGLYINRRVELEGWDIELEFRRMANRFRDREGRGSRAAGLLAAAGLAAGLAVGGAAPEAVAQSPDDAIPASMPTDADQSGSPGAGSDPQQTIEEVLEAPEFGRTEEQWRWVPKTDSNFGGSGMSPSNGYVGGLARLLELLFWLAAGAVVVAFAYIVISRVSPSGENSEESDSEVTGEPTVADLGEAGDSAEFELPPDLVRLATEHWERGDYTGSLSLLYRGTVRGLADHHGIDIAPYMTARECTRKVEAAGGPGGYMAELARAWTSTAYADRPPSDDEARTLFANWRRHFEGGRG